MNIDDIPARYENRYSAEEMQAWLDQSDYRKTISSDMREVVALALLCIVVIPIIGRVTSEGIAMLPCYGALLCYGLFGSSALRNTSRQC